jgi:hypothetical protein
MWVWSLSALLLLACGGPTAPAASAATASTATASANPIAPARAAARTKSSLDRSFSGADQPSLVVHNGFLTPQHVFIDWSHQTVLAPQASHVFPLAVGTHTITCSDSADPDDNPESVTETFDAGYAYRYRIAPAR